MLATGTDSACQFTVAFGRRIEAERKDRQAPAIRRQLGIAGEVVEIGDVVLLDAIQLVQQPGILTTHRKRKEMISIGEHGGA